MRTKIEQILCGLMMVVASANAFAVQNESKSSPADSLRSVSLTDLPAKAVELVVLSDVKDRQSVAIQAVKVSVELNPDATTSIVKSLCQLLPDSAPAIAAAAARLQPDKAASIAIVAATVAPEKAGSIVFAVCNEVPGQFRAIAEGVARIVPSATRDILLSIGAAIPDLKATINQRLFSVAGAGEISVESAIAPPQFNFIRSPGISVPVVTAATQLDAASNNNSSRGRSCERISFHRAPPEHDHHFGGHGGNGHGGNGHGGNGHGDNGHGDNGHGDNGHGGNGHGHHDGGGHNYCAP